MKFLCRKCESFMGFQKLEGVAQDSLGVTFSCPSCGTSFSMITNAGETNLVGALGVKIGGRETPKPFEFTRSTLKESVQLSTLNTQHSAGGGCPFSEVVANFKSNDQETATNREEIRWTEGAKKRLENVPSFVREFAKKAIEQMAKESGLTLVDGTLMDKAKSKFM